MSLQRVVEAFGGTTDLPIEIPDVRDEVTRLGFQDQIIFSGQDADPGKCRGVFYQFTTRDRPYSDPVLQTLIVYNSRLSVPWQRMVCCKEMVHLMDRRVEQTRTSDEVQGLLDKLLGPFSTEDYGIADLMAAHDRLALYQALPILFPDAARADALAELAANRKSKTEIYEWTALPPVLVEMVLDESWPALKHDLMNC
jgi:hypothetical protein